MEIPLLARVMKAYSPLRDNLANVLGFDYLGALGATLLFPFLLLPFVGLYSSSLIFGGVNLLLGAGVSAGYFRATARRLRAAVAYLPLMTAGRIWRCLRHPAGTVPSPFYTPGKPPPTPIA